LKKELLQELKQEKEILEKSALLDFDKIKLVEKQYEDINKKLNKILNYNLKNFTKDV
jgi:hypothetical protein